MFHSRPSSQPSELWSLAHRRNPVFGRNETLSSFPEDSIHPIVVSPQATRLDPIVTSLGKVGGGGYSSGTLDAQRENNRLTGETNRLLKDMNRTIGNLGGSGRAASG